MLPLLIALSAVPLPPQPEGLPFPLHEWTVAPLAADVDAGALTQVVEQAVKGIDPFLGETRAVVVIHRGQLVFERYAEGYDAGTRLISWSVAKSITHALVGIAADQGLLDPDQPMGSARWKPDDARAQSPWRTWLEMNDGQGYVEFDAQARIAKSDAPRKLYGPGRLDVAGYCAELPLTRPVGKTWNYNSCGIVLADDALTNLVAPKSDPAARRAAMRKWMFESLFEPIGMRSAAPQFDANGLFYGSALFFATARDYARLGYLYLRDGRWGDRQLLPRGWVDFARTGDPDDDSAVYGAGFWLTSAEQRRWLPADAFRAQGFEGQVVMIVPSKDLVVVRLGLFGDVGHHWDALADFMGKTAAPFPDLPR